MTLFNVKNVGWVGNVGGVSGPIGGWKELGRTASAGPINVTGLANKRYYMILNHLISSGATVPKMRTGNTTFDSGSNYAERRSNDGATDGTAINADRLSWSGIQLENNETLFGVGHFANLSAEEKLLIWHTCQSEALGDGTAPSRREGVAKWVNTANPLDRFQILESEAGSFTTDSELVILGWDPLDTHTDNFWEELASENGTGTTTLDSGTFTAKKYIWVQAYLDYSTGENNAFFKFNGDGGTNYAITRSQDGGADSAFTSNVGVGVNFATSPTNVFLNMFLINCSANEKLCSVHGVGWITSGAATGPNSIEEGGKWDNVASQITQVEITSDANSSSTSIIKVWGHD